MYKNQGRDFQRIEISLASPKDIRLWAERFLPNGESVGEVISGETVNYKTLKPEPNGLFCQKIFGPMIDYTCACGKKAIKFNSRFCSKCGVERTTSKVRRYRMGFISFNQPMAHTLYSSQKPSPLGICLNWPNKKLQAILYGTEFCHLDAQFEYFSTNNSLEKYWIQYISDLPVKKSEKKFSPRLFKKKNPKSCFQKIYSNKSFTINFYGVSYESAWRQVEDFQDFLSYLWQQRQKGDSVIPYYSLRTPTQNVTQTSIPRHHQYYPIQTGGFVFQDILAHYNVVGVLRQLNLDLMEVKKTLYFLKEKLQTPWLKKKEKSKLQIEISRFKDLEKKLLRRLIYFRDFYKANLQPAWMLLSYLPVLPPGLRPITSIGGKLVVSDINSFYRKILTRNRRLMNSTKFSIFDTTLSGSWTSWCYNLRQVQESVDSLLKTGKIESGKTTKSLLDSLKGKRGRFRQHLLGKRVDYSGRSVIVVGPELKIYECGLPKQMAIELFQPFLIQQLRNKGIAFTTTGAKAIILERRPIIWVLLREILQSHPILLNRAPTLHRLGIQAFIPKLVEGKAILLHPLVCPAFNADFDGDQMAVHVPLSLTARAEAFNLLLACNHLLSPASGQPLLLPTQDMVLGFYYLTISNDILREKIQGKALFFHSFQEVMDSYNQQKISLHSFIWVFYNSKVQNFFSKQHAAEKNKPIELRIDTFGNKEVYFPEKYSFSTDTSKQTFICTTPGRIFFANLIVETAISSPTQSSLVYSSNSFSNFSANSSSELDASWVTS